MLNFYQDTNINEILQEELLQEKEKKILKIVEKLKNNNKIFTNNFRTYMLLNKKIDNLKKDI